MFGSFFNYSSIEDPPLDIVQYSQWSWTFITAELGSSISPSKPGSNGKNTITLNYSLFAAAYLILLISASEIVFSTGWPALPLMKN